jgi:hypothetical protein
VIAANGRMGGFSANGGEATKRRLLAIEGLGEQGGSRNSALARAWHGAI